MQEAQSAVAISTTSTLSAPPTEIIVLDDAALAQVVGAVAFGPGGNWCVAEGPATPGRTPALALIR